MNFEKPPIGGEEEKMEGKFEPPIEEKLISPEPKLRYITKTLELLKPEEGPAGEKTKWTEIYKNVKPYANALELTDNVREVTREWVAHKIPDLKNKIPSIKDLEDKKLMEALSNGWFEEINEEAGGQRREILLAVAAHVTRRIETHIYQKILEEANEKDLEKLGLNSGTRELLTQVLDTSVKANPLFVRFLAFSQLSGRPPKEASPVTLYLPGDKKPHTMAEIFPHETQFLAKRFSSIADGNSVWMSEPGGQIFKNYLRTLIKLYSEKDAEKTEERQKEAERVYAELIASNFPVLITLSTEGYYKEPYFDPELKISLSTPDSRREEECFRNVQKALAESLEILNVEQFKEAMRSQKLRVVHAFGSYGVNLIFNAVAQEKPAILLWLNEQIRQFDRDFPEVVKIVKNSEEEFIGLPTQERTEFMKTMSRIITMLHEFAHRVYPDDSKEAKRLGRKPLTIIDEVKAETFYRPLVPSIIEKGGLKGTKEQWAIAMLGSSSQTLKDQPPGDPYYHAVVYGLNDLFKEGAVEFKNNQIFIKDFESYYKVLERAAREIVSLFENEAMTEKKAAAWVKKRCLPNEKVKELEKFLRGGLNTF